MRRLNNEIYYIINENIEGKSFFEATRLVIYTMKLILSSI